MPDRDRERPERADRTKIEVKLSPLDVHLHGGDSGSSAILAAIQQLSSAVLAAFQQLAQRVTVMAGELDTLTAEVERNTTVDQSVITLVEGLAAKIEGMKNDPVKLQALADSLRSSNDAVATAVAAHTVAEDEPQP